MVITNDAVQQLKGLHEEIAAYLDLPLIPACDVHGQHSAPGHVLTRGVRK